MNLSLRIFKMATVAMETEKRRENLKCSKLVENLHKGCLTSEERDFSVKISKMAAVAMQMVKKAGKLKVLRIE